MDGTNCTRETALFDASKKPPGLGGPGDLNHLPTNRAADRAARCILHIAHVVHIVLMALVQLLRLGMGQRMRAFSRARRHVAQATHKILM